MERDLKMGFILENLTPEQEKAWRAAYEPKYEDLKKRNPKGRDLVRWKYQRYLEDYLACIASVDDNIGRMLDYLDETGLAENTMVIYTSDQGFYLGEHGWFDKRWIYEESLKTPLIIRWKGKIEPGSVNENMVMNLDFAETFIDAAGAPVPRDMQGRSMLPLLTGAHPSDWRRSVYYHYYEDGEHAVPRHYGVRTERYKLAHYYQSGEWELFDLEKDPRELRSVYDDPSYAPIKKELEAELDRLRKSLDVPDPDPEEKLRK
jgi:arylsulfatase A-like enzyme